MSNNKVRLSVFLPAIPALIRPRVLTMLFNSDKELVITILFGFIIVFQLKTFPVPTILSIFE